MRHLAALSLLSLSLVGCAASTATVISSSGPGISASQSVSAEAKPRIAVQPFEFRSSEGAPGVGAGMADMLTDALFNTGKFTVVERDRVGDLTAEQDLGATGRFNKDTVAPIGQLEGAELLIRGSITSFERNCSGGSIIVASTKESCIGINLRIVDVRTGRVVNATTVEATSANRGVGLVFTNPDLPIGLGAFSKTPMEKAIRNAIEAAVQYIAANKI